MHKRIPIAELSVGMRVVGLDIPWLRTPFLRNRLTISRPSQIDKLKACGSRYVDIEVEEVEESVHALHEAGTERTDHASDPRPSEENSSADSPGARSSVSEALPWAGSSNQSMEAGSDRPSPKARSSMSFPVPQTSLDDELPRARETHQAANPHYS